MEPATVTSSQGVVKIMSFKMILGYSSRIKENVCH